METKLKMVGELMRFSGEDYFPEISTDEELSLDELEMVAAAGAAPHAPSFDEFMKKVNKR